MNGVGVAAWTQLPPSVVVLPKLVHLDYLNPSLSGLKSDTRIFIITIIIIIDS